MEILERLDEQLRHTYTVNLYGNDSARRDELLQVPISLMFFINIIYLLKIVVKVLRIENNSFKKIKETPEVEAKRKELDAQIAELEKAITTLGSLAGSMHTHSHDLKNE